jgi:hypothetical protein
MNGAEMFLERHERLALALLTSNSASVAEVRAAMSRIIASAPVGTDIALVLSLAMAYAGDRVSGAGAPRRPEAENG